MRFLKSGRVTVGVAIAAAALIVVPLAGTAFSVPQQSTVSDGDSLALVAATSAQAANVDAFLKIDGIEGESADAQHRGEIDILSWSWGASQAGAPGPGAGAGAGRVSMEDFHFTMQINKASPRVFQAVASGEQIQEAVLVVRRPETRQEFLKVTFTDVLISSYQTGSANADVHPIDEISLNFSEVAVEYRPQRADGSLETPVTACYDLKANTTC
ncbi:MAG: type VI secretion system tube protein Hcp [Chloroflexi bacterium]|nr:type VI secretion system tube protein Hcp [Chloroflexota bacterium]